MSSTYSIDKRAAAVVAKDGTIYYGLFEKTYESNVYPQVGNWCAIHFGTAAQCMDNIIARASACEGGMLKERGGDTTPSAYIKHWRAALASPVKLKGGEVSAKFGVGVYSLDPARRDATESVLRKHGHPGLVDDNLSINVSEQPELLRAVLESRHPAWRFLSTAAMTHTPADWAAYVVEPQKGVVPEVSVFSIREAEGYEADYWISMDGAVTARGWKYSTIGHLIDTCARTSEQAFPGSAESAIRAIRAIVNQAKPFSMTQRVQLDGTQADNNYHISQFQSIARQLGMEGAERITTSIGDLFAKEALYDFRSLPDKMVTFIDLPPIAPETNAATSEAMNAAMNESTAPVVRRQKPRT